jgi:hypothetical protein
MAPILDRHQPQSNRDLRIQSAAIPTSTWRRFLAWNPTHSRISRPMRSVFASLVFVIAAASLSFPLWRAALGPDSDNVDPHQTQLSRDVPKEESGGKSAASSTDGSSVYVAQLVRSSSFVAAAEALDRINARYPSLLKEQSVMIRKGINGEDQGIYIGGVGGLKFERDAEQLCSRIRARGERCKVVTVPRE